MARLTSPFLAICVTGALLVTTADVPVVRASVQVARGTPGPGEPFLVADGSLAIFLEEADLHAQPSADSAVIVRAPAGAVLDFRGTSTDTFGRTWTAVRDPDHLTQRRDTLLAPFTYAQFLEWGSAGALLADRDVATGSVPNPVPDPEPVPWWIPEMLLVGGHAPAYRGTVGISGRSVDKVDVEQAIELLGGPQALGDWPPNPLPGQLFVPAAVPLLYQWNGEQWQPVEPLVFLGPSLSLIPNTLLRVDHHAPLLAGGPVLPCWDFVGALSPTGTEVGTIQEAQPFVPGAPAPSPLIAQLLAPPTLDLLVPPRVDPVPIITGVQIRDSDSKQAVYLEQTLSEALTQRLRGRQLVLDVWARTPAGALSAATFGIDIEVRTAPDVPGESFSNSFSVDAAPTHVEWPFTVSEQAAAVIVRLLPVDKSVAVEQRGAVAIDRVALRLSTWSPELRATVFPLHKVSMLTYDGVPLYTRAAVAVSQRSADELRDIWPAVAAAEWHEEDKRMILAGRARPGMSPDQVRLSWGKPAEELELPNPPGARTWRYEDRSATFLGDTLISVREPNEETTPSVVPICGGVR